GRPHSRVQQSYKLEFVAGREGLYRRRHRPTLRVAKHEDQARTEMPGPVIEGLGQGSRRSIARHTRHEQITDSLIEDQFRRDPRIRAGDNRCEWRLPMVKHALAANCVLVRMRLSKRRPLSVSRYQRLERSRGRGWADSITLIRRRAVGLRLTEPKRRP